MPVQLRTAAGASVTGGCYCGACRFYLQLPVQGVLHCHCSQCRRLSGAGYTTWVSVPVAGFSLCDDGRGLTRFRASANTQRFFCRTCGSTVYATDRRYLEVVGVPLGVIEGAVGEAPSLHAFYDSRAPWVSVADDLPCLGGVSGFEPLAL